MENLEHLLFSKKWNLDSRRVSTIHKFFDYSESGITTCLDMFGVGISQSVFFTKNGDISRYLIEGEHEHLLDGFETFLDSSIGVAYCENHMVEDCEIFIEWLKLNCRVDKLQDLSNEELARILSERHKKHMIVMGWQWLGFSGKYVMDKLLFKKLARYSLKEEDLKLVLLHKRPVSVTEEEIHAKDIAIQVQKNQLDDEHLNNRINDHIKEYGHILVYDETGQVMTHEFLKQRVLEYVERKSLENEVKETRIQLEENQRKFKFFLDNNKFEENDLEFVNFASEFSHFVELRNSYRGLTAVHSKDLFKTIAQKLSLTLEELLCFSDAEIGGALLGNLKLLSDEAENRKKYSVVILNRNDSIVLKGDEADYIEKFVSKKIGATFEINGTSTTKGVVSGTVKVIISLKDISKVDPGDILVSPMTKPTFLLGMKKAAAIVTDEGGMLCHAAILSRELKIPCIVGTKIATQVLVDGDKVEVDADNGVVRVLKKAIL